MFSSQNCPEYGCDYAEECHHSGILAHPEKLNDFKQDGVFADQGGKLIRKYGWKRPLKRIHPPKPRIGIRASRPNQYWHIDVSILRLQNNQRVYIHAIIDNFSRMILSWRVFDHLSVEGTRQILIEAAQYLTSSIPDIILIDGGSENRVERFGDTLQWAKGRMRRALVDIAYSNSMIEAFWRKIKCSFLFKYNLDSLATVTRLIAKFI